MEYFKFIERENWPQIQEELWNTVKQYPNLLTHGANIVNMESQELTAKITEVDSFIDFLEDEGLLRYAFQYMLVVVGQDNEWVIHTDYSEDVNPFMNKACLVLPLYNTANCPTTFYEELNPPHVAVEKTPQGTTIQFKKWMPEDVKAVDSYMLDRPTMINTSLPHGVGPNTSDDIRVALVVDFNHRLSFFK